MLVLFSLISLGSGMRGGVIGNGIKTVVGIAATPFLTAINAAGNGKDYVTGLFFNYNEMRESLDEHREEFTRLQHDISDYYELRAENERLRGMLAFQREQTQYDLMPAEVIQHSQGVITIDRGSIHGVRGSMCVVTAEGIIGLVRQVGPFTANVVTLQSNDCRVDAMIDWNRVRGQVQGTGNEMSSVCSMHYIDLNDQVREGDLIVTSPDSVFPAGYPIGRVVGVPERGQLSQSANIMPAADPFSIDEVFILIAADIPAEELAGGAYGPTQYAAEVELMDTSTIQERYAP